MLTSNQLKDKLHRINRRGYKAYKDLRGEYNFGRYVLCLDSVQSDPFAPPSRARVIVDRQAAGFPTDTYSSRIREIALRDFLARRFFEATRIAKGRRGSGNSGKFSINRPGQEVLERSSVVLGPRGFEVRFGIGLPAYGRSVASEEALEMLFKELPQIVEKTLFYKNLNSGALYEFLETVEDADFIRNKLAERGLVAFVANGAVLPRKSGIDSRPLLSDNVVRFSAPPSLSVAFDTPNHGRIEGMGIPEGVTLIVGGGFHGKSTLLNAIELGIYNHIPGDGREFVVTRQRAFKIRAEDGRYIEKVSISPFINNLPFQKDTTAFSTENASGSTSQAANIIEALEAGCELLLMDEDTCATNFMIRDAKMQELVSKANEPITPFIDKVRSLYEELGVSTILVMGGSGDYLSVADTVICMIEYKPYDYTERARSVVQKYGLERRFEGGDTFGTFRQRVPIGESIDPSRGKKASKIKAVEVDEVHFGQYEIELDRVEQLVDRTQLTAIGYAIQYARRYMDGRRTLSEVLDLVLKDIEEKGLDTLHQLPNGDFSQFRKLDLAAAINRLRSFKVR